MASDSTYVTQEPAAAQQSDYDTAGGVSRGADVGGADAGLRGFALVPPYPVMPLRRFDSGSPDDELGGTEADAGVTDALRRRNGAGRPLDRANADRFGGGFGADLSDVRVHTDGEADTIARSVQSVAFTYGKDVYFTQGSYAPGTDSGDHLLAHELAHVVQGSSGRWGSDRGSGVQIGRADDPAETAADEAADQVIAGLRRKTFDSVPPTSTIGPEVRRTQQPAAIRRVFGKMKKFAKSLFGKADAVDDVQTQNPYIDNKTHDERMTHQRRFRGSGPGENPDYSNPALFGSEPDSWDVTLAVAQEDTKWMTNIKELKRTAIRELASSPTQLLGDLPGAQQRLVERTLMARGDLDGKTNDEISALVEKFTDGLHDVGHTWIRMTTYVGGTLKDIYSYGMWPQKLYSPGEYADTYGGYAGPVAVGPGEVKHPDVSHEGDATKAYKHYAVKEKEFDKALSLAVKRYDNPPPYVLTGYNCTAFAREIVQAAGKTYPGKGLLPGMAYTPGNLYWAIMKEWAKGKKGIATDDTAAESAGMTKLKKRAEAFQEAGVDNVEGEYKTAQFALPQPGAARSTVKFHGGSQLNWGMYPGTLDQVMKVDKDTEYTFIDDPTFTSAHDVVPIEIGAQICFVDLDDFLRVTAPPKVVTLRSAFFDRGLEYFGTFKPPTDADQPRGAWTVAEVAKKALLDFKDPNATDEWIAVGDQGEVYWVRRDHLGAFRDPDSVSFHDELDDESDDGSPDASDDEASENGSEAPVSVEQQKAAVEKVLDLFKGQGSMSASSMLYRGWEQDGVHVSASLISELIANDPSFRDVVAKALGCSVADVKMDFG